MSEKMVFIVAYNVLAVSVLEPQDLVIFDETYFELVSRRTDNYNIAGEVEG